MTDLDGLIGTVGEAIECAALDPTQWPAVLDAICGALPGTKGTIYVADTGDRSSIGVVQRGFTARQVSEYERHYGRLNPWVPLLMKTQPLQSAISDELLPAWSFRESEFYQDWLAGIGGMESTVGMKLVHEPDRIGVIAIHYAPGLAGTYNPRIARLLQGNATRFRRAIDAARLARTQDGAAGAGPMPVAAFALPALLLDGRGRVVDLNRPAMQLVEAGVLSVDAGNVLQIGDAMLSERILAVAGQIAASRGPWSDGLDLPVTAAGGARFAASLLAVRTPAPAGVLPFFPAPRLTLMLLRPSAAGAAAVATLLKSRFGLTGAERRLAVEIASGLALRECAERFGIAYQTARSQLKAVFDKTGTSRQAELVALLARLPDGRGEG